MTKVIKPLLATKADYSKINYPVLATPKLDGIRCLMVGGVAMSRSMKPIPNDYVRKQLEGLHGLDGELMVNGDFNAVQSGIMKKTGEPDFTYHVFDDYDSLSGYEQRVDNLSWDMADMPNRYPIKLLVPITINNEQELDAYMDKCMAEGYEGVMIRDPNGPYKFGRSTVKEGILLKIKRFHDDEGELIEITEKMTNMNALEEDELGYAKRASNKENLVPAGTAGSVTVKWNGLTFKLGFGPGWNDEFKEELWFNKEEYMGRLAKFSYQELSKDGVPRFGKLLEIRHEDDL